jgi:hypothetical protein
VNEDGFGYSGEIRAKSIARDRIVITIDVNQGAQIIFRFLPGRVIVKEIIADYNSG